MIRSDTYLLCPVALLDRHNMKNKTFQVSFLLQNDAVKTFKLKMKYAPPPRTLMLPFFLTKKVQKLH